MSEIAMADEDVRRYIAGQFGLLMSHPDFEYAVQGNLKDRDRSELFFARWEAISAMI